jgi:uncharacterized surface anchored protein
MKSTLELALRATGFALAVMLLWSSAVLAQEITGSINGTVKDVNGGAVKGATVTITDSDKKIVVRTVVTNDDGEFSAPLLPVAYFDIAVDAANL